VRADFTSSLRADAAGFAGYNRAIAVLLVIAVAAQGLQLSEAFFASGRQNTTRLLLPPALRVAPVHDEAAFFGEIAKLRSTIDADRAKTSPDDAFR
jgi:hypothetical protein